MWVKGDGQGQWVTISLRDAANKVIDLRPGYATGTGWTKFSVNLPASGVEYPVRVDNVRLIETAAAKLYKGSFIIDDLEVDVPSEIATPPAEAPLADRLIDADGTLDADWTFAALSDVQFTAAAPDLSRVAIAALKRIRAHHPDFVVLNGDIVDTGYPADVALAKQTLEAGGCDLVESRRPGRADRGHRPVPVRPGQPRVLRHRQPQRVEGRLRRPVPDVRPQGRALRPAQHRPAARSAARTTRSCRCCSDALDDAAGRRVGQARGGLRPPPDQRPGPGRRQPARRPQGGRS